MRLFLYELKKIWNWKLLLITAIFAALTWLALLSEVLKGYESLKKYGAYGSYQTEMFELYGDTLESGELANFDFPGRFAEIYENADAIIAREPVFIKYNITDFERFIEWYNSDELMIHLDTQYGEVVDMIRTLYNDKPSLTFDKKYASPLMKWQSLRALESRYVNQQEHLDVYIENDMRPPVVRAAERLKRTSNNNLINEYLMPEFSLYAAITGVFVITSVIILVIPLLITDRSRNINLLQYTAKTGRKIIRTQFAATFTITIVLSAVLTLAIFAPFITVAWEYWNTIIMSSGIRGMWLYNVTFGQYVFILAGIIIASCTGAAGFAFILARFSTNIVNAMIKAVPAVAALAALLGISVFMALSNNNIVFNQVLGGRVDIPEVILCVVIGFAGAVAAALVVRRERRRDLT